jgi:GTPase
VSETCVIVDCCLSNGLIDSMRCRLYGKQRSIVSAVAGTTRDAIDVKVQVNNETFRLIDTAGVRKKNKIHYGPEFFMINR